MIIAVVVVGFPIALLLFLSNRHSLISFQLNGHRYLSDQKGIEGLGKNGFSGACFIWAVSSRSQFIE